MANEFLVSVGESLIHTAESGVLLWLGSMWIGKAVENYRANQSLRVALSTKRAEKIDAVSALLFHLEMDILNLAKAMTIFEARFKGQDAPFSEWSKKYIEISEPVHQFMLQSYMEIRKNYFMLGPVMTERFLSHHRLLQEYDKLLASNKMKEAQAKLQQIEAQKPSVLEFIKNPDL